MDLSTCPVFLVLMHNRSLSDLKILVQHSNSAFASDVKSFPIWTAETAAMVAGRILQTKIPSDLSSTSRGASIDLFAAELLIAKYFCTSRSKADIYSFLAPLKSYAESRGLICSFTQPSLWQDCADIHSALARPGVTPAVQVMDAETEQVELIGEVEFRPEFTFRNTTEAHTALSQFRYHKADEKLCGELFLLLRQKVASAPRAAIDKISARGFLLMSGSRTGSFAFAFRRMVPVIQDSKRMIGACYQICETVTLATSQGADKAFTALLNIIDSVPRNDGERGWSIVDQEIDLYDVVKEIPSYPATHKRIAPGTLSNAEMLRGRLELFVHAHYDCPGLYTTFGQVCDTVHSSLQ